jgi:hypothetical protein
MLQKVPVTWIQSASSQRKVTSGPCAEPLPSWTRLLHDADGLEVGSRLDAAGARGLVEREAHPVSDEAGGEPVDVLPEQRSVRPRPDRELRRPGADDARDADREAGRERQVERRRRRAVEAPQEERRREAEHHRAADGGRLEQVGSEEEREIPEDGERDHRPAPERQPAVARSETSQRRNEPAEPRRMRAALASEVYRDVPRHRRERRVETRSGRVHHQHRHGDQRHRAERHRHPHRGVSRAREAREAGVHADEAVEHDRDATQHARGDVGDQHAAPRRDESAVRQHRIVERIARNLEERDEQEIHTSRQGEAARRDELCRAVRRDHQQDDPAEQQNHEHHLQPVGEDRGAHTPARGIGEHARGEREGARVEREAALRSEVARHDAGVAPDLVEEPDQDRAGEHERRRWAEARGQEWHQSLVPRAADPQDEEPDRGNRQVPAGVGEPSDEPVLLSEIRGVGDALREDPGDEHARGEERGRWRAPVSRARPEEPSMALGAWGDEVDEDRVPHQHQPRICHAERSLPCGGLGTCDGITPSPHGNPDDCSGSGR